MSDVWLRRGGHGYIGRGGGGGGGLGRGSGTQKIVCQKRPRSKFPSVESHFGNCKIWVRGGAGGGSSGCQPFTVPCITKRGGGG